MTATVDISTLALKVDSTDIARGVRSLDTLAATGGKTERKINKSTSAMKAGFSSLKLGIIAAGTAAAAAFAVSTISSASRFETGLIGVAKTTGLAGVELDKFAKRIDSISRSLPITTDELLELSQAAGQMGVTGSANLEKFSLTIAKLGRASDLAGAEAATSLARILNVTGEAVDSVDTLASVIVALGNSSAASESQIARMTNEVARATAGLGISSAEAAAMAAAMSELGIQAELGGTALGTTMRKITAAIVGGEDSLNKFANALDLDGQKLAELFKDNKVKALEFFLENVGELGLGASIALKEVGLGGEGVLKVLGPLSTNMDKFATKLATANAEVVNATALDREFEATLDTLGSQWIVTKNIMEGYARSIGQVLIPAINSGLKALNSFFGSSVDLTGIEKQIDLIASLEDGLEKLNRSGRSFDTSVLESEIKSAKVALADMREEAVRVAKEEKKLVKENKAVVETTEGIIKATKDLNKSFKNEARQLELSLDPLKKRNAELAKLVELRDKGGLSPEIFDIAATDSINRYLEATKEVEESISSVADETKEMAVTTRDSYSEMDQYAIGAARNIQSAFADFLFDPFEGGLKGMFKSFANILRRMVAEIAASKLLSFFTGGSSSGGGFLSGVSSLFGGTSGGSGGGFSLFDGANLLNTGRTIYQGFSGGLLSSGASAIGTLGETFGIQALSSFSSAFGGAATSGVFGPGGVGFLSGGGVGAGATAGTEAAVASGAEFSAAQGAGVAAGSSAATAATGFGLLALATSIGNSLIANDKEIAGQNSEDLRDLGSTFKGFKTIFEGDFFGGALNLLGAASAIDPGVQGAKLLEKIPGIGGFLGGTLNSFIPDVGAFLTSIFGRGPFKTKETNLIGQATAEGFEGVTSTKLKAKGGLLRSNSIKRVIIDADTLELSDGSTRKFGDFADSLKPSIDLLNFTLDGALTLMNQNISEVSKNLGLGSTEGFSTSVNIASRKGEFFTADEITAELKRIEEEFIRFVLPSIDDLVREGESIIDAFQRIGVEFGAITTANQLLGSSLTEAREAAQLLGVDGRSAIIETFGGIDQFSQKMSLFGELFLDESRKLEISTENMNSALEKFGITVEETSVKEFGELIESFLRLGVEGAAAASELLDLASGFVKVKKSAEAAAAAVTAQAKATRPTALQDIEQAAAAATEIRSAKTAQDFIIGQAAIDAKNAGGSPADIQAARKAAENIKPTLQDMFIVKPPKNFLDLRFEERRRAEKAKRGTREGGVDPLIQFEKGRKERAAKKAADAAKKAADAAEALARSLKEAADEAERAVRAANDAFSALNRSVNRDADIATNAFDEIRRSAENNIEVISDTFSSLRDSVENDSEAASDAFALLRDSVNADSDLISDTFSELRKATRIERDEIIEAFANRINDVDDSIRSVSDTVSRLTELSNLLSRAVDGINPVSLTEARDNIRNAIAVSAAGGAVDIDVVQKSLGALIDKDTTNFSSRADFVRSQAENSLLLDTLNGITVAQLTTEEQSLASLELLADQLRESFDSNLERLDLLLETAEEQSSAELDRLDMLLSEGRDQLDAELDRLDLVLSTAADQSEAEIAALNGIIDIAQEQLDAELLRLDGILDSAQLQLDALNGIDNSILSIADALSAFSSSVLVAETLVSDLPTVGTAPEIASFDRGGVVPSTGMAIVHAGDNVIGPEHNQKIIELLKELILQTKSGNVSNEKTAKLLDDVSAGGNAFLTEAA